MFKVSPLGCGKHAVQQPGVRACLHVGGGPQVRASDNSQKKKSNFA